MQFLKSLARGFGSSVFKLSLFLLAIIGAFVMVFGTPNQLKQSLRSSNIYKSAVDQLFDSTSKNKDSQQGGESSPFDQPEVKAAAKTAVTPAFLQSTVEQVIDGIYGWLNQKTAQPEFQIDISQVKQQFTQAVGDYAVNRAKQLPACNLQQTRELAGSKIDPLSIPCVPRGFDVNTLRDEVSKQLNNTKDENILKNSVITPDNLPKDDQGKTPVQSISEKGKEIPKAFHWLKLAPWILGGLALLSGGLAFLLYDERRRGLRNLAVGILGVGVVVLVGVLITGFMFAKLDSPTGPLAKKIDNQLEQPALAAMHSITNAINHSLLTYGVAYVVIGGGTLLALHFTKPKKDNSAEKDETPEETKVETETPKESDETKDKPDSAKEK